MIEVILFAATSFVVGLSGAIVPGPMLTVTISDSMKKGFKAGPMVVSGHIIAEIILIVLIFAGLGWLIGSSTASFIIGTLGGIMLILMGYNITRSSQPVSEVSDYGEVKRYGPVIKGFMTSVSNPYFFIWWATVGCAFMFKGLELAGAVGVLGFIIGHWASDLGWFSTVSFLTSRGSGIMNEKHYKIIMTICGAFLIVLGVYFILSAQKII
ncbi:threonine/homoserine/homoserine lactone efflux protein [Methanobacterium aggregans]|nr:LysE family transporter [Methanobacterium aggregans]MBP2046050.1 threonine/homoserine/homoserine lactone efflux protein [Methanobacterium aggregans]